MESDKKQKQSLTVKTPDGFKAICVKQIMYINSENKCSVVYLNDMSSVITFQPLKWYDKHLFKPDFFHCYISCIVNSAYVELYDHKKIKLTGGIELKISRDRFDLFKENLEQYVEKLF